MMDFIEPFTDDQVYHLPDAGNGPSFAYILRDHKWYGDVLDNSLDPSHTATKQGVTYPLTDVEDGIAEAAAAVADL